MNVLIALLLAVVVYLVLAALPGVPFIVALLVAVIVFVALLYHPLELPRRR